MPVTREKKLDGVDGGGLRVKNIVPGKLLGNPGVNNIKGLEKGMYGRQLADVVPHGVSVDRSRVLLGDGSRTGCSAGRSEPG